MQKQQPAARYLALWKPINTHHRLTEGGNRTKRVQGWLQPHLQTCDTKVVVCAHTCTQGRQDVQVSAHAHTLEVLRHQGLTKPQGASLHHLQHQQQLQQKYCCHCCIFHPRHEGYMQPPPAPWSSACKPLTMQEGPPTQSWCILPYSAAHKTTNMAKMFALCIVHLRGAPTQASRSLCASIHTTYPQSNERRVGRCVQTLSGMMMENRVSAQCHTPPHTPRHRSADAVLEQFKLHYMQSCRPSPQSPEGSIQTPRCCWPTHTAPQKHARHCCQQRF